jgi:hypothetical protein
MSSELLCKDCKHSFVSFFNWLTYSGKYRYSCRKAFVPESRKIDPVIGPVTVKSKYDSCTLARIESKQCGPEAKNWEPKSKKHFFLAIKHSDR